MRAGRGLPRSCDADNAKREAVRRQRHRLSDSFDRARQQEIVACVHHANDGELFGILAPGIAVAPLELQPVAWLELVAS